jgi:tetratricopeptide (TPR) repeat protein
LRIIRSLNVALAAIVALASNALAQDPLSVARTLYESASYAEALSAVGQIPPTADLIEVEKYRALCLLALGREKEAEQGLEALAISRPLFTFDENEAPPKLVALYSDVRRRTLPEASKQLYQRARMSFDKGDMVDAREKFQEIIKLADTAPKEQAALMEDLKVLATGFVTLTEKATKTEATPAATVPAATVPAATSKPAPIPAGPAAAAPVLTASAGATIYDASNTSVRSPVAIRRNIPIWTRPAALRRVPLAGVLDVVVDEQGNVVEAKMATPIHVTYDAILIDAARRWRYEPATAAGKPVRYRLSYAIKAEEGK